MNINKRVVKHPYRTFGIISTFLVILGIFIGILIYRENKKQQELYLESELKSFSSKMNSILATYEVFSKYIFEESVNKEEVLSLMNRANSGNEEEKNIERKKLYEILKNNYRNITRYNFRQLHFHLANGDSFIRFHSPKKFGDNLTSDREGIKIVVEEKKFIKGFEEGKIYNGYRFIYPIFYENNYVGSVEISISMATLIEIIKDLYKELDVFFMMDGNIVEKIVFDDMMGNYEKIEIFQNYYFDKEVKEVSLRNTKVFNNKKLKEFFQDTDINERLKNNENFSFIKKIDNEYYLAQFISIKNIGNNHVAYMMSISKISHYKDIFSKYLLIFFLILLIVLISIVSSYIYITDKNKLKILSQTDYLTKVFNRVRFMEMASYEFDRAERYGSTFSIVMIDIDFFKKVNDSYGHNLGDEILVELCNLITKNLRKTDLFARWGGEEFVCLLPDTDAHGALTLSENIRKKVEEKHFYHIGHITISLGVYQISPRDVFLGDIIEKADKALYKSKNSGRNKVSLWLD